jgi:nucleoside-diphosphate-sugar epimerase
MKGCSGVYHLAGSVVHSRTAGYPASQQQQNYPQSIFETNVTYSVNVMKAASKAG